jgi:hypothetical protein
MHQRTSNLRACVIPVHELTKCVIQVPNRCSDLTKVQTSLIKVQWQLKRSLENASLDSDMDNESNLVPTAAGAGGAACPASRRLKSAPALLLLPSAPCSWSQGSSTTRPYSELEAVVAPRCCNFSGSIWLRQGSIWEPSDSVATWFDSTASTTRLDSSAVHLEWCFQLHFTIIYINKMHKHY